MTMTIEDVYAEHHARVRQAITDAGLDPDIPENRFKLSRGTWFNLHDATRLALTEEAGFNDELGSRRRAVPVADLIASFLGHRVGQLITYAEIMEGVGCGHTSVSTFVGANPGVLVQTPTKGVYSVSNAARADDLAEIQAGMNMIMGHGN